VAALTPRETVNVTLAATDVPASFAALRDVASRNDAQVQTANLTENNRRDISAQLDFTSLRSKDDVIAAALAAAGEQLNRQVDRQSSGSQVTDKKVQYRVKFLPTDAIPPREINAFEVKVDNVDERLKYFQARVKEVQGRIVDGPKTGKQPNGKTIASFVFDVPLATAATFIDDLNKAGYVAGRKEMKNPQAPEGKLALARFDVMLFDADLLLPRDEGFMSQLRNWVSISLRGLSIAVSFAIAMLLFLAPWAIVTWAVVAIVRRRRSSGQAAVPGSSPQAP